MLSSRLMPFRDLQEFVAYLERKRLLKRVSVEVDPVLEASEIAQRVVLDQGPAILFERPKGASTPLLMNLFGTMERVREALGRDPAEIGRELLGAVERMNPPTLRALWENRDVLKRALYMRPSQVSEAACQEVIEEPDLGRFPILQCWPLDAGRFITFGMVVTEHPRTHRRNLGLYRLQVYGKDQTGMHWQSMKGGRGHYWEAEQQGNGLDVAVVIGADPIVMMSSIFPLPEDMDELGFAGFLRGKNVPMVRTRSNMLVPASAEIILEGTVPAGERRREGPFGDHFGHYSDAADFPVFHINRVTRRRNAIYVGTVVGKPPQEDKFLGMASGEMIGPLIKVINPNIVDLCAYVGAGFHNLLVVSLKERHPKEVLKTAMNLLGTGQLALTKVLVLVGPHRDPRDFRGVLHDMWHRFEPEDHLLLLPFAPLDTLDFTSFKMHVGSKLVIDAAGEEIHPQPAPAMATDIKSVDPRIENWKLLDGGFLVVSVRENARLVLQKLLELAPPVRFIVAVSPDVRLDDDEQLQWGIFTRFDPARDMLFSEQTFVGARPVYRGIVAIDATWKQGYPLPLQMDESIVRLVDRRWNEYWK